MIVNNFFSIIELDKTEKEYRELYNHYKKKASERKELHILSYSEYKNAPFLNVYVDMKCLNCDFEIRKHFGNYGLDMVDYKIPFPVDVCPKCKMRHLVPKDIYTKLTL